jgi:hypothetical protein
LPARSSTICVELRRTDGSARLTQAPTAKRQEDLAVPADEIFLAHVCSSRNQTARMHGHVVSQRVNVLAAIPISEAISVKVLFGRLALPPTEEPGATKPGRPSRRGAEDLLRAF